MTEHDDPESEQDLAASLIQESPDALLALAPNGVVLFWNKGASNIFGYSAEEARGRTLEDLLVPAERKEEARQRMRDTLEQGSALFETIRRKKDGSLFEVDVSMRLVKDPSGRVRFVAVSKRDISHLQRAREEQEMEGMFRGLRIPRTATVTSEIRARARWARIST